MDPCHLLGLSRILPKHSLNLPTCIDLLGKAQLHVLTPYFPMLLDPKSLSLTNYLLMPEERHRFTTW
jgi:hypothetical protein